MAQQIRELMTLNPVALPGTASVHEAARAMRDADIGDVIVIENNQICGIVTDRDIVVRAVAEARDPATTTLADLCSHPLVTVTPTDSIKHAVQLMRSKAIRRLPVVEGDRQSALSRSGIWRWSGIRARRLAISALRPRIRNLWPARPRDAPRQAGRRPRAGWCPGPRVVSSRSAAWYPRCAVGKETPSCTPQSC